MPHDTHSANAPFHGHAVVRAAFVSGMLGWGIGFYALVTGVTLLILAMRLRRRVQSFKA